MILLLQLFVIAAISWLSLSQNMTTTPPTNMTTNMTTAPTTTTTTRKPSNKTSWKPWCVDSVYFESNRHQFGKAQYGNTSCVTLQDAIQVIATAGFGMNESEKCRILSDYVCNTTRYLECAAFDRLLPEIGRVVEYRCGCIKAIGQNSFNRTTRKCYIPYGSDFPCNPNPKKADYELDCAYGLICANLGRNKTRCRCPVGFDYDEDKDGYGGCKQDTKAFTGWIGLVLCWLAIFGGIVMFLSVTEDQSRMLGFRRKPMPTAEPTPDLDMDLAQPEDAKMIISPDEDFEGN